MFSSWLAWAPSQVSLDFDRSDEDCTQIWGSIYSGASNITGLILLEHYYSGVGRVYSTNCINASAGVWEMRSLASTWTFRFF